MLNLNWEIFRTIVYAYPYAVFIFCLICLFMSLSVLIIKLNLKYRKLTLEEKQDYQLKMLKFVDKSDIRLNSHLRKLKRGKS